LLQIKNTGIKSHGLHNMLEEFVLEDFVGMEQYVLIDKLAEYTIRYTHLLTYGGPQNDTENCKLAIIKLQKEIERRKGLENSLLPGNARINLLRNSYKG